VSDIQAPPDPQKGLSYRLMLAVVIFLGVLIVIALGVMVVGLVSKFSQPRPSHNAADTAALALPQGAKIVEMQTLSNRLILHVRTADGDEVDIVDTEDGHLVSRVKAAK
jgi:hypothetical protein